MRRLGTFGLTAMAIVVPACAAHEWPAPAPRADAASEATGTDVRGIDVDGAVIRLEEQGGFVYRSSTWTVDDAGTVTNEQGVRGRVAAGDLAGVLGRLHELGFFAYDGLHAGTPCCDMVTTTLTVETGQGESATVVVTYGAPPPVSTGIGLVRDLLDAAS